MGERDNNTVRLMVDMSATLIHNGHIRLLKKAKNGIKDKSVVVIVGLTTDAEIINSKGYRPELSYLDRKEILESIIYVDEVVPTPWKITDETLKKHDIDYLVHGSDNSNDVKNIIQFPRTEGVSSEEIRERALSSIIQKRNSNKPMFTPGPSNLSLYNLLDLRSVFGRDDSEYDEIENTVLKNILKLTGHKYITRLQGSATMAIDVATTSMVTGNILIVVTGYYSNRLIEIYNRKLNQLTETNISVIAYSDIDTELNNSRTFDWIATSYTETADAFLSDIHILKELADKKQAKLFLDATASINLEDHHELADACAFSSCKGLGGLTGASFITWKEGCLDKNNDKNIPLALDINTYINKLTTGPYHAICSLYSISNDFNKIRIAVEKSKEIFLAKYANRVIYAPKYQPKLCTLLRSNNFSINKGVKYEPRTVKPGHVVVCHLGDMFTHTDNIGDIYEQLSVN